MPLMIYMAMCTLTEKEIAAIRYSLSRDPAHSDPAGHQEQQLLHCKTETEALRLKQVGNDHYRKKDFFAAHLSYTMVRCLFIQGSEDASIVHAGHHASTLAYWRAM